MTTAYSVSQRHHLHRVDLRVCSILSHAKRARSRSQFSSNAPVKGLVSASNLIFAAKVLEIGRLEHVTPETSLAAEVAKWSEGGYRKGCHKTRQWGAEWGGRRLNGFY